MPRVRSIKAPVTEKALGSLAGLGIVLALVAAALLAAGTPLTPWALRGPAVAIIGIFVIAGAIHHIRASRAAVRQLSLRDAVCSMVCDRNGRVMPVMVIAWLAAAFLIGVSLASRLSHH